MYCAVFCECEFYFRVFCNITDSVACVAFAALRFCKCVSVDLVDMTVSILNICAPKCASGVTCAVELCSCITKCCCGHIVEVDCDPCGCTIDCSLSFYCSVYIYKALNCYINSLGNVFAVLVSVNCCHCDSSCAFANCCDHAVFNCCYCRIGCLPCEFVCIAEDNLSCYFICIAYIHCNRSSVCLDCKVCRSVILIEGYNGSYLIAECTNFCGNKLVSSRIDSEEGCGFAVEASGNKEVTCSFIIYHGSILTCCYCGYTCEFKTCAADGFHYH